MPEHFTRKYLEAFSFSGFSPSQDESKFYYMYEKEGKRLLHSFDTKKHSDLTHGEQLISVDFNKQCFWPVNEADGLLYFVSDHANEENYNIFSLDLVSKEVKQLTKNDYTACIRVTDEHMAFYAAREIDKDGLFQSKIHIHDLKTGTDEIVTDDIGDLYRVSWGPITPSKDKRSLFLKVDKNNERTHVNLCQLDLVSKSKTILIPEKYESSRLMLLENEIDTEKGLYFTSDCDGFDNLYYYNFLNQQVSKLTSIDFLNDGFELFEANGKRYFYLIKQVPSEGKTHIITFQEESPGVVTELNIPNESDARLVFEGDLFVHTEQKDFIWVYQSHLTQPPTLISFKMTKEGWKKLVEVPFVKIGEQSLVHSSYEFVKYPSFDGLEIPAYMVIPHGEIKGAIIMSFYGGENQYRTNFQIMAEQGFVYLSPAVRGSWGHGKEWEDKLKGDLGGNEILDILWGAKFLEDRFQLSPSQIGVEGGSHGGYSTLRALTLPANFKGVDSQYPFGFGICWAGFADLVDFYKTSNIPDWLANMLGPFEGNEELYRERSPVHFFEELKAPLFITHGTKDSRVPPSTMEGFLEKLKQSEVPHYIFLMDGQGHTGGSIEERVDEYRTMFKFLEETTNLGWGKN